MSVLAVSYRVMAGFADASVRHAAASYGHLDVLEYLISHGWFEF